MEKRLPVENWHPPSIKSVNDSLKVVVALLTRSNRVNKAYLPKEKVN